MRLSLFGLLDRRYAPAPPRRKVDWLGSCEFAHRGLHGAGVPENSPAAFAAAKAQRYGVECDIQRSSDGQAMVFHDWELDRLTAETGPVARRSAAQLGQIPLSGGSDGIPTLRQLLDLLDGAVPLLIEVKTRRDTRIAPLCLAVRRVLEGYHGPHAIMSFDPRVPAWFARYSPLTTRGIIISEENNKTIAGRLRRRFSLWHARAEFLAYDVRDLPSGFAAAQRRRGLPVVTWTVRTPELRARAEEHADAPIAEAAGFA